MTHEPPKGSLEQCSVTLNTNIFRIAQNIPKCQEARKTQEQLMLPPYEPPKGKKWIFAKSIYNKKLRKRVYPKNKSCFMFLVDETK